MNTALVACENASVIRSGRRLVDGVSLTIRRGERIAVVGPNGAGKTTLLRVIAGLTPPDLGRVHRPPEPPAWIWQGLHLVSRLSVIENVLIGALARCRSPATWLRNFPRHARQSAAERLAEVGILALADERVDRISGGERQRTAVARALMQESTLLLADEPTASVDPAGAQDIALLIRAVAQRRGLTLVTVLHDISLVPTLADRVLVMEEGRVRDERSS